MPESETVQLTGIAHETISEFQVCVLWLGWQVLGVWLVYCCLWVFFFFGGGVEGEVVLFVCFCGGACVLWFFYNSSAFNEACIRMFWVWGFFCLFRVFWWVLLFVFCSFLHNL